jgi:molybdenum cofactor cytidylyltransferase
VAHADPLAVALLAAGRSIRFGDGNKMTTLLRGRPLLAWAAEAGRLLPAEWHLLVGGADASLAAAAPGYRLLANPQPERGLATSLRIAVEEAERLGAGALLVMLGDMPFVQSAHLCALVAAFRADGRQPVFSQPPQGPPSPPALFPAACFAALKRLEGDRGARALSAGARFVPVDAAAMRDIDTPEDITRAEAVWREVRGD